jgi:hypothetical protein
MSPQIPKLSPTLHEFFQPHISFDREKFVILRYDSIIYTCANYMPLDFWGNEDNNGYILYKF